MSLEDGEYFEDRAAVMEFDGGFSRADAEKLAAAEEKLKLNALARWIVKQDMKAPGFAKNWLTNARPSLADVVRPLARAYYREVQSGKSTKA